MLKNGLKNKQIALQLLPFCFIFTFLAYLASGQPTDLETFRYLIFVVFIIPFGICYAISRFSSKSARILITFGIIILSTTNIIRMNSGFKSRNNSQLYENNLLIIETINEQGLNHGYTSYWNAGINTFLSKNTIQFTQVACVNHKILPFKWLASQKWFEPQNYLGKTFLMIDHVGNLTPELKTCNLEDIANQFGEPSRTMPVTVEGGTFSLIIFDYNIAERLY